MVFVVEYNAMLPPDASWAMRYNSAHEWRNDSYQGASLKSLTDLATRKGYTLIACSLAGVNSFFLRNGLVREAFVTGMPSDSYHPAHYFALHETVGHPRGVCPSRVPLTRRHSLSECLRSCTMQLDAGSAEAGTALFIIQPPDEGPMPGLGVGAPTSVSVVRRRPSRWETFLRAASRFLGGRRMPKPMALHGSSR